MEGNITLVLRENRLEVSKERLASKSNYFLSLFTHNFSDSHSTEHIINYDISSRTLKDFVEWVQDDTTPLYSQQRLAKDSMIKFLRYNFKSLLKLLELSVLYAVDELIEDIIDIIALAWLKVNKVITIWMWAQELNIKVLQDICFCFCLEHFEKLPVSSLAKLSKEHFSLLIYNVNISSPVQCLENRKRAWMRMQKSLEMNEIPAKRGAKFVQGIVSTAGYLYTWDGRNLTKVVQLRTMYESSEKLIVGMQVAGKGFSIYTIGGEMGLGSGLFNTIIYRYCLVTKRWFYVAKLPIPRRHMVAVFIKNSLVVVGGVGKHRLKLTSVDILNLDTGVWSKGEEVPESFTEVPPHYVVNETLLLYKSFLYIYYFEENVWQTLSLDNGVSPPRVNTFITPDKTLFMTGFCKGYHVTNELMWKIRVLYDVEYEDKDKDEDKDEDEGDYKDEDCTEFELGNYTVEGDPIYRNDQFRLQYARVAGVDVLVLCPHDRNNDVDNNNEYIHVSVNAMNGFNDSFSDKLACISIIDPNTVYDIVIQS